MTALDNTDELVALRARYNLPPGVIRLDGTSGGPLPRTTPARLRRYVDHQRSPHSKQRRIDDGQIEARRTASALAPLLGAEPDEIVITESAAMNLFVGLVAASRLRPDRPVILVGADSLETDRYLAQSAADFTGNELRLVHEPDELPELLDDQVAVVALSHVDLDSGTVRDARAVTQQVRDHGALALWDLSHSAGALSIDLHGWDTDFALGCGHTYLGGGPGSSAYCFVSRRHGAALSDKDIRRSCASDPMTTGIVGAPSVLSTSELRAAVSILDDASSRALETKTRGLITLFLDQLPPEIEVVAPIAGARFGTQVSLRHPHASRLAHELFARDVLFDYLEPDLLRFSFSPAWLRYADVWDAADRLREALRDLDRRS